MVKYLLKACNVVSCQVYPILINFLDNLATLIEKKKLKRINWKSITFHITVILSKTVEYLYFVTYRIDKSMRKESNAIQRSY